MISLKRTAAILLAASLLAVSMAACSTKVGPSSSSPNTSSASSDTSSVTSDTSSVTSDTSSVDSSTNSTASGTSSVTPGTSTAKPGTSTAKPGTSTAKPGTSPIKPGNTVSIVPSNSTSGIVKNMNGRTVVFQMIQSNATDAGPKDKHVERYKAKIAAVEKQYNCKIVVSASNNETMGDTSVKNSVIAGKPKVDIWNQNGFTMEFLPHYIAGLIQPLDPLKCFNFSDKAKYEGQAAGSAESMIINGIHFGVMSSGGSNGITGFQNDQMMFYRTDVLQKSGITPDMMPVALAEKGQWTWDNFAKDCQKVRAAGNIPLQDNAGSGNGINQNNLYAEMCYTFGTDFVKQDASTRTVTFNGGSAAALQALDLYTSFVKNRTIDAPAPNVHEDMSSSDKIAFSPVCTYMAKWLYPRWGTEVSKANWGIVYLPKVKASDSYTAIADALQGGQCISYGVKQPADAATVLQALTPLDTENNAMKAEVMMDFELWVNPNNAKDILKILNEINDIAFTSAQKWEIDGLANGCGVSNDWLAHVQKIATGQENAGTVIAANTGKYNDTLKKLYVIR